MTYPKTHFNPYTSYYYPVLPEHRMRYDVGALRKKKVATV